MKLAEKLDDCKRIIEALILMLSMLGEIAQSIC